jgi:quinohemoprotein ethanol dehydrogenase
VTLERVQRADAEPGNWLTEGRNAGRTHHSPLTTIHSGNVAKLGVAWDYATGTNRGMEATPIIVDGVMYAAGVAGRVYVLNAATGTELWRFEPTIDMQVNRWACCDAVNHGVVVWHGRVYVGALDGRLYSLDAHNGQVLWSVDTIVDHKRGYSSVGAPEIVGDLVVIGNGGGEFDTPGYVSAYDQASGTLRWRFNLVPTGDANQEQLPELQAAAKTWDTHSRWDIGVGGNAWDAILYDPEFNLVYIGTGNGQPHSAYSRSPAGGDNLYVSSIVALHADTGRLAWYVQQAPGDAWDFDATQPMMLAEMSIEGQMRKVLLQAPKTGFFYVIDRPTGKVLSAKPFVPVTWAKGVDLKSGRVMIDPAVADYSKHPALIFPSGQGGHNWNRMAFNPRSGIAYIPVIEIGEYLVQPPGRWEYRPQLRNMVTRTAFSGMLERALPGFPQELQKQLLALKNKPGQPDTRMRALLRAFDPLSGRVLWETESAGGFWDHAGVLSTDGNLVFQGTGTGHLQVRNATDGSLLKDIDVGTSITAAPATYTVNGEQFVAVLAGYGGAAWYNYQPGSAASLYGNANRIIAFKLGGTAPAKPVTPLPPAPPIPEPPASTADAATIERGGNLFRLACSGCHGDVYPTGSFDLRRLPAAAHATFKDIVLRGQRLPLGMPRFDDVFSEADADAIHAYIIDHAWTAYRAEQNQTPVALPAPVASH